MQIGRSAPGIVRFGLLGLTSVQYRKLFRHTPVPGTTTPLPYGLPRLCVTQTRLPSLSPTENDVVCPGSSPVAGGSIHCSVGPAIGSPSATRARNIAT